MSQTDEWTILRLLEWTTSYLKQRGSESPRLDAEVLLAHAKQCRRIDLYTSFNEVPDESVRAKYREMVKSRAEGKPVAYLTGHREFYSLDFEVTPDVLIPRPETEFLLIALLDLAKKHFAQTPVSVADVGTGSGIIAVCAAKNLPQAKILALDKSPAALEVARRNARKQAVQERIEFQEADLLANLPPSPVFHFVVSNPPYITSAEMETLPPDVKNYEPRMALEAGPRGTEVIERLIPQAAERLFPGGFLLLEISPMIAPAVTQLLQHDGRFELLPALKDLAGHVRVLQARLKMG